MLLPSIEYRVKLEKVVGQIKDSATLINIRGEDVAQFIYATNGIRSIEVYQCDEGVLIELWNKDNELPLKEMIVSHYEEAAIVSLNWLNSQQ